MTDMPDICVECGHASLVERVAPFTFAHGGKHATIEDRHTFCPICGTVSYVGAQADQHELAVAAKIREIEGLPSADDLRRIRQKYALRQTDLEATLSVGPKTWTRWERGKVPQSKAADTLIRLIDQDPAVVRRLMEKADVVNPVASAVLAHMDDELYQRAKNGLIARLGSSLPTQDPSQLAARAIDAVRNARLARTSTTT
jgi:putative zinc finger/helix-turn-helix YgiT family protein